MLNSKTLFIRYLILMLFFLTGCQAIDEINSINFNKIQTPTVKEKVFPTKIEVVKINKTDKSKNIYSHFKKNIFSKAMEYIIKKTKLKNLDSKSLIVEFERTIAISQDNRKNKDLERDYNFNMYSSSKSNIVIKLTSNKHKEKREFRFLYYDKKKSVNTSSKTFLPFDPNKIKLLEKNELIAAMGPPTFKRLEGDVITWQYSNETCVLDVFFEKNSEVLIFLDTRSHVYGKMLNEDKCYKVFGQKVLSVD